MSRYFRHIAAWVFVLAGSIAALAESPFAVSPSLQRKDGAVCVHVAFTVPTNTYLYADHLSFGVAGEPGPVNFALPECEAIHDRFSGEEKRVFKRSFAANYRLNSTSISNVVLTVRLQGCDDANCYFPEEKVFMILSDGTVKEEQESGPNTATSTNGQWQSLATQFEVRARGSGYLSEKSFIRLLDEAEDAPSQTKASSDARGSGWDIWVTLCLIVLGGVGLNLTPCILPMIPINLAIIGAGAQAGSKRSGFLLGGAYAAGMAVAYGLLGVFVVLTGTKFGTLNSSPWFNLAIAAIFLLLGLAMFGVFVIDLSRFQGRSSGASSSAKGKIVVAYSMGTVAALLAGACVAPVVISVLVQATTFYNKGVTAGLFLPFLLGIGMGLPWPFAGAGLSFLPKPGVWMTRVKYGFGVLIMAFAGYYGLLSFNLFRSAPLPVSLALSGPAQSVSYDELTRTLLKAQKEGKCVFIDFWASWCKNCSAMEHTTFKALEVRRRLGTYLQVRFQAERPNQPGIKEVLDYFGAFGLPTYVVLRPRDFHQIDREEKTVASASLSDESTDSANRVSQPK